MRISLIEGDTGFMEDTFGYNIFFNEEPLKNCIVADEEQGYAIIYRDEDESSLERETIYGNVKIIKTQYPFNYGHGSYYQ